MADDVLSRLDELRAGQLEILEKLDGIQAQVDELQKANNVKFETVHLSLVGLHSLIKGMRDYPAAVAAGS